MNDTSWYSLGLAVCCCGVISCSAINQTAIANSPEIPDSLKVPSNQQFLFKTSAKGKQIYTCQATNDRFEWTLKSPEAVLRDENGKWFGLHYFGPSWEAADGSKIAGEVKAKSDAPKADAIPWLLLQATSHEGDGVFKPVNWVVRLNTNGGKAPVDGCDRTHQNHQVSINYTADYYFYGASSASKP
jgi:hypothetical protein